MSYNVLLFSPLCMRSWGPRCKPQMDYKMHEEEGDICIPYVRSIPVKRERRIIARLSTPENNMERIDNFTQWGRT